MTFCFGEHVLDLKRRQLTRGAELVKLETQVFDVLAYLVCHRDRVVSKDELLASVWEGRIVSESALTTRINAARRAIGDDGAAQRLIRTFTRKGFRFIGEVREIADTVPSDVAEAGQDGGARHPDPTVSGEAGRGLGRVAPPRVIVARSASGLGPALLQHARGRLWAALTLVVVIAGTSAWLVARTPPVASAGEGTAETRSIKTTRASIAVLPFATLGADGSGSYFAEGLTEDIITALGRFRGLSVIAPAAVFAYEGKRPTPQQVGRELDVQYVVEGSVRRTSHRIRITASLADAASGTLLWALNYDVVPKEIFAIQDDITRRVSGALVVKVTDLELAAAAAKPPSTLDAYDLMLRGRSLLARGGRSAAAEARTLFERVAKIDPNYAPAYVGLGRANLRSVKNGWTPDPSDTLEDAERLARKAIALEPSCAECHALLGTIAVYFGEYERARDELKRAIKLNPSDANSYSGLVQVLLWSGDTKGAITAGEFLAQIRPHLTSTDAIHLGLAYLLADRAEDAARVLEPAADGNGTNMYPTMLLAAACAAAGRQEEAEREAAFVRQRWPSILRKNFGQLLRNSAQREKLARVMAKAGL